MKRGYAGGYCQLCDQDRPLVAAYPSHDTTIVACADCEDQLEECKCCGAWSHRNAMFTAMIDGNRLCLYCQPCPNCHRYGTDCTDDHCDPRRP